MKAKGIRAADLRLADLFDVPPRGGVMRFAGERVLLLDAVALGLLRKQLFDSFGHHAARSILTRFGFSHGWRTAEALRDALPWADEREWRIAGGRLHRLKGLVTFEPVGETRRQQGKEPFADAIWHDSYEAEQHLLHLGQADEPVCWTLAGFASGYLSRANGRAIYAIEESCRGRGDAICRMVGKSREEWGEQIEPFMQFYETDCLEESLRQVQKALRRAEGRLLRAERAEKLAPEEEIQGIVSHSEAMRSVLAMAKRVAKTNATVLISGESGVGKERIARLVHDASPRAFGPFVAINCAAMPESLLESELFGHTKGAFSGAIADRVGLFEAAKGGTLFLDEIGDLPLSMQAKLLRVLEAREVRRLGENRTHRVDVRIVAATHKELEAAVEEASFRQDLYYRLRVVEVHIPPLRERPEDILPIAKKVLADAASRTGVATKEVGKSACRALYEYRFPGNVRELLNAMERASILSDGPTIELEDLPPEIAGSQRKGRVRKAERKTIAEVTREHVLATLATFEGNRERTAEALGIGVATLYRKLKEYAEQQ